MVSKPCEHSGIACRPAKCAGTCDFSSLALLFGQVLFGNIYAFFWQNVAIYALFRKISPFMQFFGKMSRFTHFFLGSAQTVKITLSSAFKFLSALEGVSAIWEKFPKNTVFFLEVPP